jgi:hypothetical protein
MSSQPTRTRALRICAWAALISLLVTAIVPVLFFRFPGPKFIPLRYEWMWAITEFLWKPLRLLQTCLDPLVAYDLRQHVNPYFVAPLVNAPVAFVAAYVFLKLRARWRNRSRKADGGPELQSLVDHVEAIRTDYPAALHTVPHAAAHAETVMQEARAKVAGHPYFQPQIEPEASRQDNKHE